uniref:Retrovirus-related Pol polyprotein from transposon 17.6 n=1 Tax=Cajanus cajan TaxID=3821 RepID=A0A151R8F7_CAJCA|nr:Retrovirus-related Pol polyprotein from transposon 17.6 [Cajanus cajan]
MLALPDFSKPSDLETDAFTTTIGVVLLHNGHPLAYFSKKLCPKIKLASAYAKEMYTITETVKKWRQYLLGNHFRIFTDQQSLKHMLTQVYQTPEKQRWAFKLQGGMIFHHNRIFVPYVLHLRQRLLIVWEDINMDFVTHLPSSFDRTVIWVVVDWLSKYSHFLSLPTKFSATALANHFATDVYRLHGTPRSIVSNRDSIFLFWYNTSYHSAIDTIPFQASYGRPPPAVRGYIVESSTDTASESLLQDRAKNLLITKEQLRRTQQRGTKKIRVVSTLPLNQCSLVRPVSHKLGRRYHGPFQVICRIGAVAYELALPEQARLHPVFHVSLLRHFHGAPPSTSR